MELTISNFGLKTSSFLKDLFWFESSFGMPALGNSLARLSAELGILAFSIFSGDDIDPVGCLSYLGSLGTGSISTAGMITEVFRDIVIVRWVVGCGLWVVGGGWWWVVGAG